MLPPNLAGALSVVGYVLTRGLSDEKIAPEKELLNASYEFAKGATANYIAAELVAGITSGIVASVVGFGVALVVATLIDLLIPMLGPAMLEAARLALPVLASPTLHRLAAHRKDENIEDRDRNLRGMGLSQEALTLAPELAQQYIAQVLREQTSK